MTVYADTSALIALVVDEARSAGIRSWFSANRRGILLSEFTRLELSAVISRAVRTQRLSATVATSVLDEVDQLQQQCRRFYHGPQDFALADRFIRDFSTKLAAPDALHLASAMRAGASLLTVDDRLADATRANGVEVVALAAA